MKIDVVDRFQFQIILILLIPFSLHEFANFGVCCCIFWVTESWHTSSVHPPRSVVGLPSRSLGQESEAACCFHKILLNRAQAWLRVSLYYFCSSRTVIRLMCPTWCRLISALASDWSHLASDWPGLTPVCEVCNASLFILSPPRVYTNRVQRDC